jgi:hypothetical protein
MDTIIDLLQSQALDDLFGLDWSFLEAGWRAENARNLISSYLRYHSRYPL